MASHMKLRGRQTLLALLFLFACGVAAAGELPAAPRHPAIVIYVGAG